MGDFDGASKWKRHSNGNTFYWCGKSGRWSTTHWTNEHRGTPTPSANLATPTVLGDHDPDEDWPCAFFTSLWCHDYLLHKPSDDNNVNDLPGFDGMDFCSYTMVPTPSSLFRSFRPDSTLGCVLGDSSIIVPASATNLVTAQATATSVQTREDDTRLDP
jgi:hypothetical protein